MKAHSRASGPVVAGSAALLAVFANVVAAAPAQASARPVILLASQDIASYACDPAVCGTTETSALRDDEGAPAGAFLAGGPLSAAVMVGLGVALMTGGARRKTLWAVKAPWKTIAQPG
jgi:hypothetical protein